MSKKVVSFNLETDLSMSLECLSDALERINNGDDAYFKWAVIYSHNSIQTAMCLALITSSNCLVYSKFDTESGHLTNIGWLYERLLDERYVSYVDGLIIDSDRFEKKHVCRLQTIRNTFIHQHPISYTFASEELIELISFAINVVAFLVNESERMALDYALKSKIIGLLTKLTMQIISV
ncbi:hypothetical protein L1D33_04945 [Vibrio chagasii]|uniref:hypothetical protein n=1 Tax=Vibrio TaxID=662 RepID=UPI001EFE94A2|nr:MULTISPECIES: hypothetical protein [Vibrio]MCG9672907.1 hypothetical protein [Vibrio chagasii]CAH7082396.1 conserved hypothetical protein [Vibrio chagasii]